MNIRLLLWVLVIPLSTVAQNWENICSPGLTLFSNPANEISSFRLDSVRSVTGHPLDSIYYSYRTIRKINNDPVCLDVIYGSTLGDKVYKKHNGPFVFFNSAGDSIFLRSDANLSQSWDMVNLPGSGHIRATVTDTFLDSICGVMDEVKIISLQAKNASNQNIDHIFNYKQIHLSRNYGLVLIYDMVKFPNDTTPYTLVGKSSPAIGVQEFSIQETFNFDVGDEFHLYFYQGCALGFIGNRMIKYILSKEVSVTGDTITYISESCGHKTGAPPYYDYTYHDTIEETIVLHENYFYPSFDMQPQEYNPDILASKDEHRKNGTAFNGRSKKYFRLNRYTYSNQSQCYVIYAPYWYAYFPIYEYSKGLGNTYYLRQYEYYDEPSPYIVTIENKLMYYRKGTETWGTPFAADCETYVGINHPSVDKPPEIIISPNPVADHTEIRISALNQGETAEIILYDYLGREIYRIDIDSNPYIFSRAGIPDGLYIVKVIGKSGKFNLTSKILLN